MLCDAEMAFTQAPAASLLIIIMVAHVAIAAGGVVTSLVPFDNCSRQQPTKIFHKVCLGARAPSADLARSALAKVAALDPLACEQRHEDGTKGFGREDLCLPLAQLGRMNKTKPDGGARCDSKVAR